jgi:hypothetical protein
MEAVKWNTPQFHIYERQLMSNIIKGPKVSYWYCVQFLLIFICFILLHVRNLAFLYETKCLYLNDCKFSYLYATSQHCYDCITSCSNGFCRRGCIHCSSEFCLKKARKHRVSNNHCVGDTESRFLMSSISTKYVTTSPIWPKIQRYPKVTLHPYCVR